MRVAILAVLAAALSLAQSKAPPSEDDELERALSESGSSQVEYARTLERHLAKYPKSERRAEIVRILAQAAIDLKDKRRTALYGVEAIDNGSRNAQLLDYTTRALLDRAGKESLEKARDYSTTLTGILADQRKMQLESKEPGAGRGRRLDETEFALARALTFQARALGSLGQPADALAALEQAWTVYPTAEAARERARWLEKSGKLQDALNAWAEALMIDDPRTASNDRPADLQRFKDLASKAGVDEGVAGQALLAAFGRTGKLKAERDARLLRFDPNSGATEVLDFSLSMLQGGSLELKSLKGKVVVFDFWATWCGPCRAQHPLYEKVKQRFAGQPDVVFLAVSTDEDRDLVPPFLEKVKWSKQVYFDDGLANLLRINSIPTTIILDRSGTIYSRLNGFIAEKFVDMLSDRIQQALKN